MVDDKMCVGVHTDQIMARIDPLREEEALLRPGAKQMDFTGRPMKGFVFVDQVGFDLDQDLEQWVEMCLEFNPRARSSKKRKK